MTEWEENELLLDNQLCFALYAASRKVIQQYGPMLAEMDITYTQYLTLLVLWQHKTLSIKELGQFLFLDTGTLTPMLKKMEAKGLLTRVRSREDERIVHITITPAGQALERIARKHLSSLLCTSTVDPALLTGLHRQLKALLSALDGCEDRVQE